MFDTDFLSNVLANMAHEAADPLQLRHVGAADSWPLHLVRRKNAAMIFNTDYTNEVGEHWIAVYIDGPEETAYLFDSLPDRPFPQIVLNRLRKCVNTIHNINPHRYIVQQREFPLCGLYCLAFLSRFSQNQPFLLCHDNPLVNDIDVVAYMFPYIVSTFEK